MSGIAPKRYNTLNCIENCIANICDINEVNFSPLFLYSWDFGYDNSKATIGENLHYHSDFSLGLDNYIYIAENYLNVKFEKRSLYVGVSNIDIQQDLIYMISTDSYDCRWNLAYHKYHYPHYYLIEKSKRGVKATDSFSTLDIQPVDSEVWRTIKDIYCISHTFVNTNKQIDDMRSRYIEIIRRNLSKNIFDDIHKFSRELRVIRDFNTLSPQVNDISNSYIVRRLSYITNSRYNTSLLFQYLNFDSIFIKSMGDIFVLWESIKGLLIKTLISRNSNNITKACDMISRVAEDEIELAHKFLL
jgi:hypothetical protein